MRLRLMVATGYAACVTGAYVGALAFGAGFGRAEGTQRRFENRTDEAAVRPHGPQLGSDVGEEFLVEGGERTILLAETAAAPLQGVGQDRHPQGILIREVVE